MPQSLTQLEQERNGLLVVMSALGDFRPGSITGIVRRCGKASCHCAQPDDPGHGPNLRLTHKVQGKTISESLPSAAAVRKAEREVAEFRRFQRLSRSFVGVNQKICRLRPVEETLTTEGKKRPRRSRGTSPQK